MSEVFVSCQGVKDGPLSIPPFELRRGEVICMQLPSGANDDMEERLYRLLTGQRTTLGLQLHGQVAWVFTADHPPGRISLWQRWLGNLLPSPLVKKWLRQQGGLTAVEVETVMRRLGLTPRCRRNRLPGNPRMMLGLEAAFARQPDVVAIERRGSAGPRGNTGSCFPATRPLCRHLRGLPVLASMGTAPGLCSRHPMFAPAMHE
jgi:hypothetical protein